MPTTKKRIISRNTLNPSAYVIWADSKHAHVDPAVLRRALNRLAPELEGLVMPPPGAFPSLRRAVKKALKPIGFSWRELAFEHNELTLALVSEPKDLSKTYVGARCTVFDSDGRFESVLHSENLFDCMSAVKHAYTKERGVLGSFELWLLVKAVCNRSQGTMLSEGLYIVTSINDLVNLNQAFMQTQAGIRVVCLPIFDHDQGAKENLQPSVEAALMGEMEQLQLSLQERHAKAIDKGRKIRRDGVENDVHAATELRNKASALHGILGIEIKELDKAISAFETEAQLIIEESWGKRG